MPKLWDKTIEAHRREVHAAILDTTAALVAEHGLLALVPGEEDGLDVREVLVERRPADAGASGDLRHRHRQIGSHLDHLAEIRDRSADAGQRLGAVLEAYAAHSTRGHHDSELSVLLHRDEQVGHARQRLREMIRDLLTECASTGAVRSDVTPDELAGYCLHALHASCDLSSTAAVRRLVRVTLAGLRPDPG